MKTIRKIMLLTLIFLMGTSIVIYADTEWEMFNYTNANIAYIGSGWYTGSHGETTTGSIKASSTANDEYRFNFTGTSLKIYAPTGYDLSSILILDGKTTIKPTDSQKTAYGISYDITGLENKEHSVKVINGTGALHNVISPTEIYLDKGYALLPYDETVSVPSKILSFETDESDKHVYGPINIAMYMQNITEIAAEDILIQYDPTFLSFEGTTAETGLKVVYSSVSNGAIRVVIASDGTENIINNKTLLSTLQFKGLQSGDTTVRYINAKVTNGISYEKDLLKDELGEITLNIKAPLITDVNKDKQYTLLDLGILARFQRASLPNAEYNLDQLVDNKVDELDLIKVFEHILENPDYVFQAIE